MSAEPRHLQASHLDAVIDLELRATEHAAILARERARDAQRAAAAPPPTPAAPPTPAPPRAAPAPQPSPRRAATTGPPAPPAPVVPLGQILVDVDVLDHLLATHPLTREDR